MSVTHIIKEAIKLRGWGHGKVINSREGNWEGAGGRMGRNDAILIKNIKRNLEIKIIERKLGEL